MVCLFVGNIVLIDTLLRFENKVVFEQPQSIVNKIIEIRKKQ